ncbi:MAG: hypothetical protein NWT02_08895, partial [Opitutales bacterium]|nr:hypothetical protein [Opitutales bacterium]
SDYRDFAPDVDVTAPINHVSSQANNAQLSARGLHNAKITVHSNNNWNTSRGHFIDTAILDSYLFASLKSKPLGNEVTISGLGDIPNGQEVTLTLWGTGDSENSDTNSL